MIWLAQFQSSDDASEICIQTPAKHLQTPGLVFFSEPAQFEDPRISTVKLTLQKNHAKFTVNRVSIRVRFEAKEIAQQELKSVDPQTPNLRDPFQPHDLTPATVTMYTFHAGIRTCCNFKCSEFWTLVNIEDSRRGLVLLRNRDNINSTWNKTGRQRRRRQRHRRADDHWKQLLLMNLRDGQPTNQSKNTQLLYVDGPFSARHRDTSHNSERWTATEDSQ